MTKKLSDMTPDELLALESDCELSAALADALEEAMDIINTISETNAKQMVRVYGLIRGKDATYYALLEEESSIKH